MPKSKKRVDDQFISNVLGVMRQDSLCNRPTLGSGKPQVSMSETIHRSFDNTASAFAAKYVSYEYLEVMEKLVCEMKKNHFQGASPERVALLVDFFYRTYVVVPGSEVCMHLAQKKSDEAEEKRVKFFSDAYEVSTDETKEHLSKLEQDRKGWEASYLTSWISGVQSMFNFFRKDKSVSLVELLKSYEEVVSQISIKNCDQKSELKKRDKAICGLQKQLEKKETSIKELRKKLSEKECAGGEKKQIVQGEQNELQFEIKTLQEKLRKMGDGKKVRQLANKDQKIHDFEIKVKELSSRIESLQTENKALQASIKEKDIHARQIEEECKKLKQQNEKLTNKKNNQERLKANASTCDVATNTSCVSAFELQQREQSHKGQIQELQRKVKNLQKEITSLKVKNEKLVKEADIAKTILFSEPTVKDQQKPVRGDNGVPDRVEKRTNEKHTQTEQTGDILKNQQEDKNIIAELQKENNALQAQLMEAQEEDLQKQQELVAKIEEERKDDSINKNSYEAGMAFKRVRELESKVRDLEKTLNGYEKQQQRSQDRNNKNAQANMDSLSNNHIITESSAEFKKNPQELQRPVDQLQTNYELCKKYLDLSRGGGQYDKLSLCLASQKEAIEMLLTGLQTIGEEVVNQCNKVVVLEEKNTALEQRLGELEKELATRKAQLEKGIINNKVLNQLEGYLKQSSASEKDINGKVEEIKAFLSKIEEEILGQMVVYNTRSNDTALGDINMVNACSTSYGLGNVYLPMMAAGHPPATFIVVDNMPINYFSGQHMQSW